MHSPIFLLICRKRYLWGKWKKVLVETREIFSKSHKAQKRFSNVVNRKNIQYINLRKNQIQKQIKNLARIYQSIFDKFSRKARIFTKTEKLWKYASIILQSQEFLRTLLPQDKNPLHLKNSSTILKIHSCHKSILSRIFAFAITFEFFRSVISKIRSWFLKKF